MWRLLLESYWHLLRVAIAMHGRNGMLKLHEAVRNQVVGSTNTARRHDLDTLCHVMDLACVFYVHRVLCLQRSAATTLLLRYHGIPAQMVIGIKQLPFRSHAWVEVNGLIVNDKPYLRQIYQELHRC
jgi:hypothetical protein